MSTHITSPPQFSVQPFDENDQSIIGAEAIRAAQGNRLSRMQNFRALQNGWIPATKWGRIWVTTRRRLRNGFSATPESERRSVEGAVA